MELTNELSHKNSIISSLQSKANLTETTLNQLETYKKEISLLNTKLSLSKYDTPTSDLPSQLNSLKLNQTLLESTIASKDKKISQLLSIIKQYETQITTLTSQNAVLTQTNAQLKQQSNTLNSQYQNTQLQLQTTKDTQHLHTATLQSVQYQNVAYEQKIKELIALIKEYSNEVITTNNELSLLKEKYNLLLNESENVKQMCSTYDKEITALKQDNNDLQSKNETLIKTVNYLQTNNSETINENYALSKENSELKKEVSQMQVEHNKHNAHNESLVCLINKDLVNLSKEVAMCFNAVINKHNVSECGVVGKMMLLSNNDDDSDNAQCKVNFKVLIETINKTKNEVNEYVNRIEYDNQLMKNEIAELKLKKEQHEKDLQSYMLKANEHEKLITFYNEQSNCCKLEVEGFKQKYEDAQKELKVLNEMVNMFFDAVENKVGIALTRKNVANNFTMIEKYMVDSNSNSNSNIEIEYKTLKKKYDACITELELKAIQIANMEKIIDKKNESLKRYYHNVNEPKH
jgi:chromosome segregation ATPase